MFFFFIDSSTTEFYTLSLHDALPILFPLISYPKAWSPGTGGEVTAEIVYFDAKTDSAIAEFKGKLKGKFVRSEEHTSELQSQFHLVCRLLLEKKKQKKYNVQYFNNYT